MDHKPNLLQVIDIDFDTTYIDQNSFPEDPNGTVITMSPTFLFKGDYKTVGLSLTANYSDSTTKRIYYSATIIVTFFVRDKEKAFNKNFSKDALKENIYVLSMIDTAIGFLRAAIYFKNDDSYLKERFLPIISPNDLASYLSIEEK